MNRRMFFGTLGMLAIRKKLAPQPQWVATTGGARVGAIAGAFWSGVDLTASRDYAAIVVRREWSDDALKFAVLVDTRPRRGHALADAIERLKARA